MDESWFPLFMPETKRQSKQWKHVDSPPPKKFRQCDSAEKVLYAIFWDSEGIILAHPVPKGTTITGRYYRDLLEKQLLPALRQKRPSLARRGFLLHQDNAPPHRANTVAEFLRDEHIETIPHPPYSPDLAPSDFWLFGELKDSLRGRRFPSRTALGGAIYQWGQHTSKEEFAKCYRSWVRRWERCVAKEGDYVEK